MKLTCEDMKCLNGTVTVKEIGDLQKLTRVTQIKMVLQVSHTKTFKD